VGLTLRVRPQISENGTVKMAIYQEASSVDPTSVGSPRAITNKRSIESSVLVDDGAIVVLGGLMEDEYTESEDKVPCWATSRWWATCSAAQPQRTKTNLMVFLRPVVVRDAVDSEPSRSAATS
jgi:general secretion pathway protein D